MFKALVLVTSLAGQVLGFGVGDTVFDNKAACDVTLPAYVAKIERMEPGNKYMGACLDVALIDKLTHGAREQGSAKKYDISAEGWRD